MSQTAEESTPAEGRQAGLTQAELDAERDEIVEGQPWAD